jgi:dihydrofolate synthase / folylpolyglutamate synthase
VDYEDELRWLLTLPDFERTGEFSERPDVEPVRALLAELGDPQLGRPTVHIAGSKGKGSTAVIADAVLRGAGRRTGCYVSPHLHRYSERIRIDGVASEPAAFASALASVRGALDRVAPRFPGREFVAFDVLTAAAFVAFREAGCDAQVVEVGLGGTLDSTNVFDTTEVVVITPISLEHTAVLGSTVPEIARQKAGIITPGATVVASPQRESALDVVHATADERGARVVETAKTCRMDRTACNAEGQDFKLETSRGAYTARLPLVGRHQLDNAATAIVACEELAERAGFELTPQHVREGLAHVKWPARLEAVKRRPLVVLDGAHNGDSAKRMVAALREYFGVSNAVVLFGTLAGKDVEAMAEVVTPLAEHVFVTGWPSRRAAPPGDVAAAFRPYDVPVSVFGDVPGAYEAAEAVAGERGAVVAFGSISFAAAVREYLLGIESDMIRLASKPGPAASETGG